MSLVDKLSKSEESIANHLNAVAVNAVLEAAALQHDRHRLSPDDAMRVRLIAMILRVHPGNGLQQVALSPAEEERSAMLQRTVEEGLANYEKAPSNGETQ